MGKPRGVVIAARASSPAAVKLVLSVLLTGALAAGVDVAVPGIAQCFLRALFHSPTLDMERTCAIDFFGNFDDGSFVRPNHLAQDSITT